MALKPQFASLYSLCVSFILGKTNTKLLMTYSIDYDDYLAQNAVSGYTNEYPRQLF